MGPRSRLRSAAARAMAVGLLLGLLFACAGGLRLIRADSGAELVLPGATDLVVSSRGLGALRMTYSAPGGPFAWHDQIWRQLIAGGWRGQDYTFGTTRQFAVTWYSREIVLGPLRISDSAVVGGDPHDPDAVIIEFHRKLQLRTSLFPPWQ